MANNKLKYMKDPRIAEGEGKLKRRKEDTSGFPFMGYTRFEYRPG
jgi:hypothetical protein